MTNPAQPGAQTNSLGERLDTVIENLPSGGITLADILERIGQEGLLLVAAFLTIVFLVPVSIPGVSTVFGFAILLIGISRFFGRQLWLPARIANRVLPADKLRTVFRQGSKWVHRLERFSRPHRLAWLVATGRKDVLNNLALILGALLLMMPFGLIPFSNTLPALALLFLSIGLMQRDGLCVLYGHLMNLATIVYFAVLVLGGGAALSEGFKRVSG